MIIKRREPEPAVQIRRRPSPRAGTHWVPCGLCNGDPYRVKCPRCRGRLTMPNAGVPIFKRQSAAESAAKIQRRYTIADVERQGFARTGITYEAITEEVVLDYFRRWLAAPTGIKPFYGEKYQWEMMLARAGWIRPPSSWTEICERHKGKEVIKQELKQRQPVITKRRK